MQLGESLICKSVPQQLVEQAHGSCRVEIGLEHDVTPYALKKFNYK